jgi:flagellin
VTIHYNPGAHGASNALGRAISNTKKSAEKLSSGYNINRAADNASGLAVSEKMRAIIRGLGKHGGQRGKNAIRLKMSPSAR